MLLSQVSVNLETKSFFKLVIGFKNIIINYELTKEFKTVMTVITVTVMTAISALIITKVKITIDSTVLFF